MLRLRASFFKGCLQFRKVLTNLLLYCDRDALLPLVDEALVVGGDVVGLEPTGRHALALP